MPFEDSKSATAPEAQYDAEHGHAAFARASSLIRKLSSFPVLMGMLLVAAVVGNLFLGLRAAASDLQGTARYCIFEGDTWWHVVVGKQILSTHTWPTSDAYSFSAPGDPWIADEWLGEVAMAASDLRGGLTGLTILLIAFAASMIFLIYGYAYVKSRNAKAAFVSCALLLPLIIIFFNLRPQLLGYIFLLITLISLESFRQGRLKKLWFLPVVFLLWVNTHGTFALGFGIVALYWLGGVVNLRVGGLQPQLWTAGERRHLEIVTLLSLLAATITPYGTRLTAFPLQMALFQPLTVASFQEWKPPGFDGSYGKYFLVLLLIILVIHLVARMEYRLEEAGLLLLAVYGACVHTRLIVFFVMIIAGVLAQMIERYVPRYEPGKDKRFLNAALIALIAFGCVKLFPSRGELRQVVNHGFPEGAVAYLRQHPSAGPVFDKEFWGGYLIKELGPQQKVFIDGRADLYEEAGVLSDYLRIIDLAPDTPFLLRKYHIRSCLVEPQSALAVFLAHSPGWTRAYGDQLSVLFVRRKEVPASGNL
ncbi:MAG: hypothetical protein M1404_02680 [Acidobacteria bacterium]|nr:hypothetical protein [Acidobacteriota bacterium]